MAPGRLTMTLPGWERLTAVLGLLSFVRPSHPIGLTFDNQLAIVANDCYTRISIGSTIAGQVNSSRIEVKGIFECEQECSRRSNSCQGFAFGVGQKGNGSCVLAGELPTTVPGILVADPDYDVYVKRHGSPICEADRLDRRFKPGSSIQNGFREFRPTTFGNDLFKIVRNEQRDQGSLGKTSTTRFGNYGARLPSTDERNRIQDTLANRNKKPLYFYQYDGSSTAFPAPFSTEPSSFKGLSHPSDRFPGFSLGKETTGFSKPSFQEFFEFRPSFKGFGESIKGPRNNQANSLGAYEYVFGTDHSRKKTPNFDLSALDFESKKISSGPNYREYRHK